MHGRDEITKINKFLSMVSPIVFGQIKMIFQSVGLQVDEKGLGADFLFIIKSGEKEIQFSPYNLLLEIATINRDKTPLEFDENLRDFEFFLAKTARLTQSKLNILFKLLAEDGVEKAVNNICQDAKQYERIRIWRFDWGNTPQNRPKPRL